jgi:glycerol-3-phosphate dehydrogenase
MEYDITIIGAGIHGAGVAQAAAAAGYSTLIIEQYQQPGLATSSRSSKLIHGGLRYLETAQLGLVWECLRERRRLLENAPHLVKLVPFFIPVYDQTHRSPITIMLGLTLYALLGGKGFRMIPRSEWDRLDGLKTAGLKAVFQYYDAQTDDKTLTQSVLQSAVQLGAHAELACKFQQARIEPGGCSIEFEQHGATKTVRSRVLINATGPWINTTLQKIEPTPRQLEIDLVQGTHIQVPGTLEHGLYYLEAPQDKRAVLVMPWHGEILIGTTEKSYRGDPELITPSEQEIEYLLEVYRHYFSTGIDRSQVTSSFVGLRVLKRDGDSIFHRTRETILHVDQKNSPMVLSIYGGKLSSYRATGEKVIKRMARILPKCTAIADTKRLELPNLQN